MRRRRLHFRSFTQIGRLATSLAFRRRHLTDGEEQDRSQICRKPVSTGPPVAVEMWEAKGQRSGPNRSFAASISTLHLGTNLKRLLQTGLATSGVMIQIAPG